MQYIRKVGTKTNGRDKKKHAYINLPEAIVTGSTAVLTVLDDGSILLQFK
jgi:hypothetical protein